MRCRFPLRQPPSTRIAAKGLVLVCVKVRLSPGHFLLEISVVCSLASQSECVVRNLPGVAHNF